MSRSALELWVWVKHRVAEALSSDFGRVHELLYSDKRHAAVADGAKTKGVISKFLDPHALAKKIGTDKHQDIGARVSLDVWESFQDWYDARKTTGKILAIA